MRAAQMPIGAIGDVEAACDAAATSFERLWLMVADSALALAYHGDGCAVRRREFDFFGFGGIR